MRDDRVAALWRPAGGATGRPEGQDHGLVLQIEEDREYQPEADVAGAPGRRADRPGRSQPGRYRAEDPPDRRRDPQRPEGLGSVIPLALLSRSPPGPTHLFPARGAPAPR